MSAGHDGQTGAATGKGDATPPRTLREARPSDLPALASLERSCFAPPWSEHLLRLELDAPGSLVLVAESGGADRLDGYAVLRTVADEAELLRVAVRPDDRRAGIGRGLVEAGLDAVARRGAARCFLEVRADNRAAIALYRTLGFAPSGTRSGYYPEGTDALLMAVDLAEASSGRS
jgi:ribosomal-protein-alanine N-acetyltransferase